MILFIAKVSYMETEKNPKKLKKLIISVTIMAKKKKGEKWL